MTVKFDPKEQLSHLWNPRPLPRYAPAERKMMGYLLWRIGKSVRVKDKPDIVKGISHVLFVLVFAANFMRFCFLLAIQ